MNHEGTKNTKEEGKKKNLFTRQLVLDRLLGEKRSVPGFIDCMSTENYFQTFRSALARIYNKNCKVVGADFLVNQYHLLTFRLFGFPQGYDLGVWANDELLDAQATHSIQIEAIKVPRYQIELGFSDSPVWDKSLQGVVGMAVPAEKKRKGVKAAFRMPTTLLNSELLDAQATHSIQIEAIKVPGYQIELGFSGSPVWDKPLQEVVGMAVAAEKKREGVKAAFRMPITVLVETGDFLHQAMQQKPINSSRSFNRVQEIKVRELEKRFAILEIDYEAVYNQLNETLDAEFKNKIQLKLKRIEQEMNDVFGELKMVG